jgi:hypothetical protein
VISQQNPQSRSGPLARPRGWATAGAPARPWRRLAAAAALAGACSVLAACSSAAKPSAAPAPASSTTASSSTASSTTVSSSTAGSGPVWLCRPGATPDPCESDRAATVVQASGASSLLSAQTSASASRFDCFFVYGTVSEQDSENSSLAVQAGETNAAIALASRFSQVCQVYAPMYRQVTWHGLLALAADPAANAATAAAAIHVAYQSILAGFEDYLAHDNRGRPVILLGDSQGSTMLILLMEHLVDDDPALRSRLVLAILPGGNVVVPTGATVGGSFSHIPLCSQPGQAGCVIAYSSFPGAPPAGSVFGRPGKGVSFLAGQTGTSGLQVACVNPAAIGGGSAGLDSFFPFLPGVPKAKESIVLPTPSPGTSWFEYPGEYQATCQHAGETTWLLVTRAVGPSDHRPAVTEVLGPDWGYHEDDTNLALGNLVADASAAEATWAGSAR